MQIDEEAMDLRPIAERKTTRLRILPKRYQDNPPEPIPGIIPLTGNLPLTEPHNHPTIPLQSTQSRIKPEIRQLFKSPRNIFGLSRTYFAHRPPNHDPEGSILPDDFLEPPIIPFQPQSTLQPGTESYHPYPNRNSYLLGHWYWCDGVQKSQQSFQNLLDIVGNPDFDAADIRGIKWSKINNSLEGQVEQPCEEEWEDEEFGWIKTPVTISVPFTQHARNPGPKNYTTPGFYRRSLVSVIKEKLRNVEDHQHFHYEPYELRWQPQGGNPDVRVYGELYSSPEFIKAHIKLQECPRDSNCDLPRVVLGLMFWSDTTHLTSFGKAQLWPLYMGFGNESKYRRCRPSLHLLNHVAYFEKVWFIFINIPY